MKIQYTDEAIARLRRYPTLCTAVQNLYEELHFLEMTIRRAARPNTPSATPHALDGFPPYPVSLADDPMALTARRDVLRETLQRTLHEVNIIERSLEALAPDEQRMLEVFYVRRPADHIGTLCEELFIERSQVYRKLAQARKTFTTAMFGEA